MEHTRFLRFHQDLVFFTSHTLKLIDSMSPSLDSLLWTIRRLLRFEGNFFRCFFTCLIRENMILVICIFIDYCTKDDSGRLEWSIVYSQCSPYFFQIILSSFCRKTRKGDCLVKFFVVKLWLECVLFFYTCNNNLCQRPIFPLVTIPIRFPLLQIFKLVRNAAQELKLPLLLKKSQLTFINNSLRKLSVAHLHSDGSV